jgi:hypothetical protein
MTPLLKYDNLNMLDDIVLFLINSGFGTKPMVHILHFRNTSIETRDFYNELPMKLLTR